MVYDSCGGLDLVAGSVGVDESEDVLSIVGNSDSEDVLSIVDGSDSVIVDGTNSEDVLPIANNAVDNTDFGISNLVRDTEPSLNAAAGPSGGSPVVPCLDLDLLHQHMEHLEVADGDVGALPKAPCPHCDAVDDVGFNLANIVIEIQSFIDEGGLD